tara:strand:- start:967 stop:1167 length:201 start_codon:yes stop_codon:yes gene_type:complete
MPRKLSDGKSNPRNSKIAGFKELRQTIGGLNSAFPNTVFWCFFAPLPSIRALNPAVKPKSAVIVQS